MKLKYKSDKYHQEPKADQNIDIFYLVSSPNSLNLFGLPQIKALKVGGFKVHAICGLGTIDPQLEIECDSISIVKCLNRGFSFTNDLLSIILITKLALKVKPKMFIYSTPKAALIGSVVSHLLNIDIRIYQIWGCRWQNLKGIKRLLVKNADKLTIKLSTHVTAVSKSVAQFYNQSLPATQFTVLGRGSTIGIDNQVFNISSRRNKKTLVKKLGYAGRVSEDKGISDLISLFESISIKSGNPRLKLEIIGSIDVEDAPPNDIIQRIKNNPKIKWRQAMPQAELANQIKNWDLQIFLSKREGLGNAILEAGACGVPTLCWDIVGTRDAVPNFAKNFLIPYKRKDKMQEAVIRYIKTPLKSTEKRRLADWYKKNFSQREVLDVFVIFIKSTLRYTHGQ